MQSQQLEGFLQQQQQKPQELECPAGKDRETCLHSDATGFDSNPALV